MKKLFILVSLLLISSLLFAQSVSEKTDGGYVASTSWVAAIAELAGLDGVKSIAPAELKHPPEYEITPDDMASVVNAELFMHAGYEKMMKTISTAAELDESKIIKVTTTNTLSNLSRMVELISSKAGTEEKGRKRFGELEALIEEARARIEASPNKEVEVYANVNQAEFARDLGLNVVSVFGAGALTAGEIEEAAEKKYVLVIDNIHAPVASVISSVSPGSTILMWRNFPDHLGENALYNVIKGNLELLWETGLF